VVQEGTLHELHRVLEPGGELRLVTDHDGLWAWYEELAAGSALFERGPFEAPASAGTGEVVGSNFERKYRREGRPFHAMTLKKDREERDPGSLSFRVRKPGTDSDNVQMSDVLCDFCRREWTEDVPMIEGHQGSCLCARCLTLAYTEVVVNGSRASPGYKCPMCLEGDADREAMDRAGEPGWQSPLYPEAVICRRCIELAARQLERDEEHAWTRPSGGGHESR
jgi:hypothetical protein